VLMAAFAESGRRAGAMIVESGAYVGSAARTWLTGQ